MHMYTHTNKHTYKKNLISKNHLYSNSYTSVNMHICIYSINAYIYIYYMKSLFLFNIKSPAVFKKILVHHKESVKFYALF